MQKILSENYFDIALVPSDLLAFYKSILISYKNPVLNLFKIDDARSLQKEMIQSQQVDLFLIDAIHLSSLNGLRILKKSLPKFNHLFVPDKQNGWERKSKLALMIFGAVKSISGVKYRVVISIKTILRRCVEVIKVKTVKLRSFI